MLSSYIPAIPTFEACYSHRVNNVSTLNAEEPAKLKDSGLNINILTQVDIDWS